MMTGEFSRISHAASIPIASAKATHKGRAGISQRDRPKKMKPWMTWLKLYQSDSCWLFWFDCTVPCHKLTVPHGQIETGRASGRDRVCQYVLLSVVAGYLTKKKEHHHRTN